MVLTRRDLLGSAAVLMLVGCADGANPNEPPAG